MRAHILQHVPFEGPGSIRDWLANRGARVATVHVYAGEPLPGPGASDLVVLMGGPMSVNDEADHPWLVAEKAFVRDAVDAGVPVLGICLGAQLIAAALGARVYRNAEREIGWFEVRGLPAPPGCFAFPAVAEAFHWHGETFDLPPGAIHLAESAACRNQAFQVLPKVLGFQFHLETTQDSAALLLQHCGHELTPGPWVQSAEALASAPPEAYARANRLMDGVLAYLTA